MSKEQKNRPADEQQAQADTPQQAQAEINPYDAIFPRVVFSTSDSDRVFTNDRNGTKSKKLANVAVMLPGEIAAIPGSIYARQPKTGKPVIEFTFTGNMRQSAVQPLDERSKAYLSAWRQAVANLYKTWRSEQPKTGVSVKLAATAVDAGDLDLDFSSAE